MTTALIALAAILIILILWSSIMGKEMRIDRSILITKPAQEVFDYLEITKNQDNFSTWNMTDPGMKKEYQGVDGQIGFIYKWDSNSNKNVGAGEQEIIKIDAGTSIEYSIRFSRPMKNVANSKFIIKQGNPNQTHINWLFYGPTRFPMSLMKPVFQKMLGKDLEKGLLNLKNVLENR
jgi:hypothetical protein